MTDRSIINLKRRRAHPNKKWTDMDVSKILAFLQEERDFELPTAQSYYTKLLKAHNVEASWDLVRWKVRHLKSKYVKAEEWLNSAETEEYSSDAIEKHISKVCPYYEQLKEIFGEKNAPLVQIFKVERCSPSMMDENSSATLLTTSSVIIPNAMSPPASTPPSTPPHTTSFTPISSAAAELFENRSSTKISKTTAAKGSMSQLAAIQAEKIAFERTKMEFEKHKFEKQIDMQEKKYKFEESKFMEELNLQKKKIELEVQRQANEAKWRQQEFELKKLELEMKERLAKYEIDNKQNN